MKTRKHKYACDNYLLTTFDEFGSKVSTTNYPNYIGAMDAGKNLENNLSFVVCRILYNSKENIKNKWSFK